MNQGSQFAHYTVAEKLGAGGMGEVYRARDSRLGRDVALKVLPEAFAADAQRMQRFQREAQVLASLNHPHIAAIYGLEESGSTRALVMELVDGPTLAERIAQGAVPVEESLSLARQLAEALEYAHEHGIIHRDLKPANIKITADGRIKVLDFGLAKALADESASALDLANSPTLSLAATKAGVILGTAAYMSPEQAKGKQVDRRADIWAFGVVLYEMLTGRQMYSGETASETMAAVIMKDPDLDGLPVAILPSLRRLLRRCLTKDPRNRLRDIGEARIAIDEALAGPGASADSAVASAVLPAAQAMPKRSWMWALAGALAIATVTLAILLTLALRRDQPMLHSAITAPEGFSFSLLGTAPGPPAVSPDGRMVAFSATKEGHTQLYLRHLNAQEAQPLAGTDSAAYPFWSPDSHWIAFYSMLDAKLKKIEVTGGPPTAICDAPNGKGGSWNSDGIIVFTPNSNTVIHRVSASGGESVAITKLAEGENSHRHPVFLPDGKHFLYLARVGGAAMAVFARSLDGPEQKLIMKSSSAPVYVQGYLLFEREGTLLAQRFDAGALALQGDPVPIAENVMALGFGSARSVFSVSENGVLVYATGLASSSLGLEWRDRSGDKSTEMGERAPYTDVALSPDGRLAALAIADTQLGTADLWIYDVKRNLRTRFTFDPARDTNPVWSPDGKYIAYSSNRSGYANIYVKAVAGVASEELLLKSPDNEFPASWSPDGKFLAFTKGSGRGDVWILPLQGDRKPFPLIQSEFDNAEGVFSPDGKWLAYISNESGLPQIYVVPFPNPTRKFQVSSNGADNVHWLSKKNEIIFSSLEGQDRIYSAEVSSRGGSLEVATPKLLFSLTDADRNSFSVTPDGSKFLFISTSRQQVTTPLQFVVNWPAKLKR